MSNGPGSLPASGASPLVSRIVCAIDAIHERVAAAPVSRVRALGFEDVTPALLAAIVSVEAGGSRLADLRGRGARSKQATSQVVTELARRGYAQLVASALDGRSKLVVPTERGSALRASGLEAVRSLSDEVARLLGDEAHSLALALERLAAALAPLGEGGKVDGAP